MSDLLFNIRFGKYHLQLTRSFRLSYFKNHYWDYNPEEYSKVRWLKVYCLFGKQVF